MERKGVMRLLGRRGMGGYLWGGEAARESATLAFEQKR